MNCEELPLDATGPKLSAEDRTAKEMGWAFWSREASKWQLIADDEAKPTEQREQATRLLLKARHYCNVCGFPPV